MPYDVREALLISWKVPTVLDGLKSRIRHSGFELLKLIRDLVFSQSSCCPCAINTRKELWT